MKVRTKFFVLPMFLAATAWATAQETPEAPQTPETPESSMEIKVAPMPFMGMAGGSFLGVYMDDVNSEKAAELGLGEERGVLISKVVEESAAEKAGLQQNDVVVGWNGTQVESAAQLGRLVRETPPGRKVQIEVIRNGSKTTVDAEMGKRSSCGMTMKMDCNTLKMDCGKMKERIHGLHEELKDLEINGENMLLHFNEMGMFYQRGRMGVQLQNLTPQLGEYFGAAEGKGALISQVQEDTPAEKGGLKAGDIIIRIGDQDVADPGDAVRIVGGLEKGPVQVTVIREKREQTVTVELGERRNSFFFNGDDSHPFRNFEFRFHGTPDSDGDYEPSEEYDDNQEVNPESEELDFSYVPEDHLHVIPPTPPVPPVPSELSQPVQL